MRKDKPKAFELRKQGFSYRKIEQELGVCRSTLCAWFKNVDWSLHITRRNTKISHSPGQLQKMHEAKARKLNEKYRICEAEAVKEFGLYKNNPLFMGGLMLYAGEGDKRNRNLVRLSNSEFYLHKVFILFAEKFLSVDRQNIKFWVLLYPDHIVQDCVAIWSKETGIPMSNFNKSQVIKGKSASRTLQYGVGNSTISSTSLKKKVLKWLELCKIEFDTSRP